jgi:hypothetical protein
MEGDLDRLKKWIVRKRVQGCSVTEICTSAQISRDMRDFQHFSQLLKTITVLHYFQRPYMKLGESKFLIASLDDLRRALGRRIFHVLGHLFN